MNNHSQRLHEKAEYLAGLARNSNDFAVKHGFALRAIAKETAAARIETSEPDRTALFEGALMLRLEFNATTKEGRELDELVKNITQWTPKVLAKFAMSKVGQRVADRMGDVKQ